METLKNTLKNFFNFYLNNTEIFNIIYGIILTMIPTVLEIKNDNKKLTKWGYLFIFLSLLIVIINFVSFKIKDVIIKENDFELIISLPTTKEEINEMSTKLPNEIFISNIRFGDSQASGTFKFAGIKISGGRSIISTKYALYSCDKFIINQNKNFPKKLNDFDNLLISFDFPIQKIYFSKLYHISNPEIKIRIKQYIFSEYFNWDDGRIYKNVKFEDYYYFDEKMQYKKGIESFWGDFF